MLRKLRSREESVTGNGQLLTVQAMVWASYAMVWAFKAMVWAS